MPARPPTAQSDRLLRSPWPGIVSLLTSATGGLAYILIIEADIVPLPLSHNDSVAVFLLGAIVAAVALGITAGITRRGRQWGIAGAILGTLMLIYFLRAPLFFLLFYLIMRAFLL